MNENEIFLTKVIKTARQMAFELKEGYIGQEHLLLAILNEEGIATKTLRGFNLSLEKVRGGIEEITCSSGPVPKDSLVFSYRAKRAVERSLEYSTSLGQNLNTGHILYAIAEGKDGIGTQVLEMYDASAEAIQKEVHSLLVNKVSTIPSKILNRLGEPFRRRV